MTKKPSEEKIEIWRIVAIAIVTIIFILSLIWAYNYFYPTKTDGTLFIMKNGKEIQRDYLGHEQIITFCRSIINGTYTNTLNLTCHEEFEGCGAVNCRCEVLT